MAGPARQQGGEGLHVLHRLRQQNFRRQCATLQIVLLQHRRQHLRQGLVGGGGEHLHLPAQQIAVLDVQHGTAGAHLSHVHAPHVRVGADPGNDLLLLAQHGDGPDAIPQSGGLFKVQLLRRLLHLRLQLRRQLAVVAGENALRLPDAAAVLRLIRPARQTEAIAPADVVVQAGPLPADVPWELPGADGELQRPAHRLDGKACLPAAAEGAEVPGAVLLRLSRQSEPGVGGPGVQPDEGVSLVVLQQDVVPGLVALDEGVFQDQRLKLRRDENGVEVVHLRHHGSGFLIVGGGVLKVLAYPVFQLLGLAYIDDLAGFVHHQIDPRQQGQVVGFFPQFLLGHGAPPDWRISSSIAQIFSGRKLHFPTDAV